jgi:hypothetical protein
MLTAEVIRYIYNSQKRFISCDDCGITYSHSDYNVLLDHQKIIYIKYKGPQKKNATLCHECFCHNIQKACSLVDGRVKLVDGSEAYILNFSDYNG